MGRAETISGTASEKIQHQLMEQMRNVFEPQLEALGLNIDQIKAQDLEGLRRSLETINDAIKHPETFGVAKIKITANAGIIVTNLTQDAHFEVGILPLLLERKQLVLERIRHLQGEEKIESIRDLIDKVSDETIRGRLQEEVNELQQESRKIEEQAEQLEQVRLQEQIKRENELAKIEIFERRSRVWLTLIERESVATIIGGVLLILLVLAQLIAMFTGTESPEIVSNAFLIILGYFFGQSVSRNQPSGSA